MRGRKILAMEKGSALARSEEHTSELQSPCNLVCRLLLEKKKKIEYTISSKKKKQKNTKINIYYVILYLFFSLYFILFFFVFTFFFIFFFFFFFFNDTATTEIYTLSLHDALPIRVWPQSKFGLCN